MPSLLAPRYAPLEDTPYCHDSNMAPIVAITATFGAAALLAVCVRFYVRITMLKFVGADDWVMLAAMLMAIANFVCFMGEFPYGLGRHAACVGPADLTSMSKWQYYHSLWPMFGVIFVKISVALFLMRLTPSLWWMRSLWAAIVFLVCFGIACAGTLVFNCIPVRASWDFELRKEPGTHCFSNDTFANIGIFNSVINIATDFAFALAPIPIIMNLQINRRNKITLAVILAIGFVACAAGIVKTYLQSTFLKNKDRYWDDGFMVWFMIELCLGIIAASLPSLKPLVSKLLDDTRSVLAKLSSGSRNRATPRGSRASYPGLSQTSGYRRHYDPRTLEGILAEVDPDEFKKSATASTVGVESYAEADPDMGIEMRHKAKSSKGMRVTSRELEQRGKGARPDGEDGPGIGRTESEERLHWPSSPLDPSAIYKTMAISRTSEPVQRDHP